MVYLEGDIYGFLKVIRRNGNYKRGTSHTYWDAICLSCGTTRIVQTSNLRSGNTSRGCNKCCKLKVLLPAMYVVYQLMEQGVPVSRLVGIELTGLVGDFKITTSWCYNVSKRFKQHTPDTINKELIVADVTEALSYTNSDRTKVYRDIINKYNKEIKDEKRK